MSKHTKKEFSDLCGIETKALSVYISRGKVVVDGDQIDDKHQINAAFLAKMQSKIKKEKPVAPEKPQKEKPDPDNPDYSDTLTQIAKEKGKLELLQRQNLIDLQRMEITKKRGELVPVSAVKSLIVLQSESTKTAYLQACDNLLIIISQKKQMSATELADTRKEFSKIVNKAIDDAVDSSKATLTGLVIDFQKKRGVGQHD